MKLPPPIKGDQIGWRTRVARFCARFATLLACCGLGLGLLLPVVRNTGFSGHPEPRGQFYADLRTLVATARYLLQPEPDLRPNPTLSHAGAQYLAQATNNRPFDLSTGFFNQMWHLDSSSNSPA